MSDLKTIKEALEKTRADYQRAYNTIINYSYGRQIDIIDAKFCNGFCAYWDEEMPSISRELKKICLEYNWLFNSDIYGYWFNTMHEYWMQGQSPSKALADRITFINEVIITYKQK